MRRFWAHITIILTTFLIMGATFFSIFSNSSMNMEYKEGREITFRLTDKDNPNEEIKDDSGVKEMAEIMKTRLDNVGVTSYNVNTVGNDIIKVQLAEPSNANLNNIIVYLGFNGSLALSNMDDNENYYHITGSEFLLDGSNAYLDNISNYPTIVIPVDTNSAEFQSLVEKTQAQKDAGVGETESTGEKDENGNDKTEVHTYLYLWYDFNEDTDRYSRTVESAADYDVNIARKIIMRFNIEDLYYPDNQNNKLSYTLNMDADSNESISVTEVRDSYNRARLYVNLLNSEALDYKVTYINQNSITFVDATTEQLVINGDPHRYLAWSKTLISAIAATLIVSLLLAVFFKLSTLSIVTTTLVSIYASVGFMVLLNAEFNIAALLGIITVSIATLASGILYASKLKEESYKGRALKKANAEAMKKALLPTVDIHVVLVIIGVFTYLFGGPLLRSFSLITVIGGLISLIVSTLGLRGLMWLLTNNTAFIGKYSLFGIEIDKLPNQNSEEKQNVYKGPYAEKDFTKRHKTIGFISLGLFVASLAGLITFGILGNNNPLAVNGDSKYSQIYVYTQNEIVSSNSIQEELFDKLMIYSSSEDQEGKALSKYIEKETTYSLTETVDAVEVTTYYFEYDLNSLLTEETEALPLFIMGADRTTLSNALELYVSSHLTSDETFKCNVKVSGDYYHNSLSFSNIILGTSIALIISTLYLLLRYRLSRGLTSLIIPIVTSTIGIGLFSLTRISFPVNTVAIFPLITFFSLIISIYIMSKDRELYLEDKSKTIGYDERHQITKNAVAISFNEILILAIITCYIGINFFGFGPSSTSLIYIVLTLSVILTTTFITSQFAPLSDFLYRHVASFELFKITKKKKNKKIVSATHRSSEPEEATFIGIND